MVSGVHTAVARSTQQRPEGMEESGESRKENTNITERREEEAGRYINVCIEWPVVCECYVSEFTVVLIRIK